MRFTAFRQAVGQFAAEQRASAPRYGQSSRREIVEGCSDGERCPGPGGAGERGQSVTVAAE
jgi:hypothetical protein